MNPTRPIELPYQKITEFCQRKPIAKLSLFGSILRDDFGFESDVDMLVEFIPGSKITYFDLAGMEIELTEMVGRKVDLRTPNELSKYFRQKVLDSAEVIYVH
ncbi:MAG: nucleotidyltransferase family protein [Leptolyngbyaceae cyanobacterium RU_5_1]|nr:nucleotidyltransferase family protein [Leptolyngbyaceae cyanobacterium RU_5_1]